MRLYLTIQRHGLPVTRILWTTAPAAAANALNTTSASTSFTSASSATLVSTRAPNAGFGVTGGCTIAQLLEDVNEVVPLETVTSGEEAYGGQWGLEDYTVEIGGYECLHFMEVDGLLKDGDEVLIRALQTSDLKARRLTGRHQISADGRHLIDGVPFGKPYLQRSTSSRPSITIPPRKRRRLAIGGWGGELEDHDEEYADIHEYKEEEIGNELALVKRDSSEESSVDDYDAELGSADEERELSPIADDEDEEKLIQELKELEEESRQAAGLADHTNGGSSKRRRRGLELGHDLRQPSGEMHSPGASSRSHSISSESPRLHSKRKRSGKAILKDPSPHDLPPKDDARDASMKSSPHGDAPKCQRRTSSNAATTPPSRKSEKLRKSSTVSPPTTKSVRFQKAADGQVEESSSDQETSESESDKDSVESDGGDGKESTSDSSSSSDQDSVSSSASSSVSTTSSDSSDEDVSSSEPETVKKPSSSTPAKEHEINGPKVNPPGHGSGPTKSNNRRSKMRRRLIKMKSLGILPPEANFADLRNWDAVHGDDPRLAIAEYEKKISSQKNDEQSEFEAKRQQLLQNLADGGVNVDEFTGKENVPPRKTEGEMGTSTQSPKGSTSTPNGHLVESAPENLSESASKRMRLDVAGSRRLLFGSLGVRTPKTKEDEEVTRKKLAGKVNDAHIASPKPPVPDLGADADSHVDEFDGDWEEKLILKATECVHDDVALSTPPFPFVQRWDEDAQATIRQRKGGKKSRKRKRGSRYTQEEPAVEEDNTGYFDGEEELNYDDNGDGPAQQLIAETNEYAPGESPLRPAGDASGDVPPEDDLPTLPDDISKVADFTKADMKAGAIVAFKQLDMSKETGWQPQISEYRVAKIVNVDGDDIQLRLAHRDRKRHYAEYDEDEGSRTYSGFEMPGYDDGGDSEDDGLRELSFEDLIDPKLLQQNKDDESSLPPEVVAETQDVSLPAVKPVDVEVGPISSPTRDNISQLIQDAGFRSKIDSDLMGSQENIHFEKSIVERARAGGLQRLDEVEDEDQEEPAVPSPTFSGFRSSPPPDMEVDLGGENSDDVVNGGDSLLDNTAIPESSNNTTPRNPVPSDHIKSVLAPSSDGLHFISDVKDDGTYLPEDGQNPGQNSCPTSFQAPAVVEESLLEDPGEEHLSGEGEYHGDRDDVEEYLSRDPVQDDEDNEDEIRDGQIEENQRESPADGNQDDCESQEILDEDNGLEDSLGYLDSIPPLDDNLEEPESKSPRSEAGSAVTNPFGEDSQLLEMPSPLGKLLASTAPARGAKSPKSSEDPKGKRRAFSSPRKAASSPPSDTGRSPSPELPPVDSTTPKPEPGPSQATQIKDDSMVVDLTLTSDPVVSPAGSDGEFVDSPGLPSGPGWVKKRTSGRGLRTRTSSSTARYGREEYSSISPPRPRRKGRPPRYSQ